MSFEDYCLFHTEQLLGTTFYICLEVSPLSAAM
jgi:hypothetical protein